MVAKLFLLLLVVAAEYTIVLGNHRNSRFFGDRIGDCRRNCDEICSQPCVARGGDDDVWIMPHTRRNDICVAINCSNSCTKRCVARNSKQEPIVSFISNRNNRYDYRNNSYINRNDICLEKCNKECDESCIQQCVTRVMGRRGELLLNRDDKCEEKCSKDCSSSCTQKCVTRNNNILPDWLTFRNNSRQEEPIEILAVYPPVRGLINLSRQVEPIEHLGVYPPVRGYRNHSRQGEELFPGFDFGEKDRNDRQQSLRSDDVCLDNCNKDCHGSCTQLCVTRSIARLGQLLLYRDDKCVEKCDKDCSSSCNQKCVTRNNRQEGPIIGPIGPIGPVMGRSKNYRNNSYSYSFRNNDVCLDKCNKDCDDSCSKECVTRYFGVVGDGDRSDMCLEQCSGYCYNTCEEYCHTRNNKRQEILERQPGIEVCVRSCHTRDNKKQEVVDWKPPPPHRNDVCLENCNKNCDESCIQQCFTRGVDDGWVFTHFPRIDVCVEKCSYNCYDTCFQNCSYRRSNRNHARQLVDKGC